MHPGRIIANKYRVLRILGRGGMGVVCEAERLDTGDHVALKFLREDVETEMQPNERFAREARLAARIDHPHACKILGVDEWELGPFIVMELLEGRPLSTVLLPEEPLPFAQAVRIAYEACLALGDAHRLGIVHRDIKPGNVFLAWSPKQQAVTKVLDFGVAKIPASVLTLSNVPSLTDASLLLGTPAYVAPEQLTNSKLVDARADVWALGVLLYEMLSGRLPFTNPFVPKLLVMIAKDNPPPLATVVPTIPAGLAQLVHRCLFKDPSLRFSDAQDLAAALKPFCDDSPTLLNPLLRAASLRPLSLSSRPPPLGGSNADDEPIALTAGRLHSDSLGPHTTARLKHPVRSSSSPRVALAAMVAFAAMGAVAGYGYSRGKTAAPSVAAVPVTQEAKPQLFETTFSAAPAPATLTLDGKALPTNPYVLRSQDDGKPHVLGASAPGFQAAERRFRFGEAPLIDLRLTSAPPKSEPPTVAQVKRDAKPRAAVPGSPAPATDSRRLDAANPFE